MIFLSAVGMVNALGNNPDEVAANLALAHAPGFQRQFGWLTDQTPVWVGQVTGELPSVPTHLPEHNSRNNQLLLAALAQIEPEVSAVVARYGSQRVAVIMGTSTSGISEGEAAVRHHHLHGELPEQYHYQQQELGDPAQFLQRYLGLSGPAYTVSTACSSSARAIISGQRLITAGLVDAALVGGADSLCRMAINGFHSLDSLSAGRCTPFAKGRDGINIGEASALLLLTREPGDIALLGFGESGICQHHIRRAKGLSGRCAWHCNRRRLRRLTSAISICTAPRRRSMTALKRVLLTDFSVTVCPAVPPSI